MSLDIYLPKQKFIDQARDKIPRFNEQLISCAWDFSKNAHRDQKRESKEPYFSHPVSVAYILLEVSCDSATIAAALLHDVVEDTSVEIKDIEEKFGSDVTSLVDGVTKLAWFDEPHKLGRERLRKLFVAIVKDPRVALIKLADRIHNLMTLGSLPAERKRRIANESLAVFAPLAEALGLGAFQSRIQNLAFSHLEPYIYQDLEQRLREKWEELKNIREDAVAKLEDALEKAAIPADVMEDKKRYTVRTEK